MGGEGPASALRGIQVLAIASPPQELVESAIASISRLVSVPCRLADAPCAMDLPGIAGRDQLDADKLLQRLEACPRPEGHWTLGLSAEDIGHPIFTFFFGRARHHGGAALVSLARLDPSFYGLEADLHLTARRAAREALHELGHVAGLGHCDDNRCIMRFVTDVEGIDNRGVTFCTACSPDVPAAFDPMRTTL